jgi:hypothetical protein
MRTNHRGRTEYLSLLEPRQTFNCNTFSDVPYLLLVRLISFEKTQVSDIFISVRLPRKAYRPYDDSRFEAENLQKFCLRQATLLPKLVTRHHASFSLR